jgi:serine/threonine-protein kinase
MGVGAQVPLARVLSPVRPVKTAFALLLGGVGLGAGLLVTLSYYRAERRLKNDDPLRSYRVERLIGKGGMAKIYLAHHVVLGRPTALKILDEVHPSPAAVERFEREARLASRLGHPNTIQIFDYGKTSDGRLTYAMEYVEGLNLAQLLSLEGPLPVARGVFLLGQIAAALEEAHELGLLHRDLKPSNIMVSKKGGIGDLVKVLDFGIACSLTSGTEDVTRSMGLVGTPAYIAPERIRAPGQNDPRSDIYSFGAVAFHLLTGRTVFEGPGPTELIYQVMTAPRPSPSQFRGERLPAPLEGLVGDCLSIDPEHRPPDFRRVIEILCALETRDRWGREEARSWWAKNQGKVERFLAAIS